MRVTSRTHFYPRSPCGERLSALWMALNRPSFLSTLSLRRATPEYFLAWHCMSISIHALLAESDKRRTYHLSERRVFLSTLSLRRATAGLLSCFVRIIFLSTLSLRRATVPQYQILDDTSDFYPRSPCGERHCVALSALAPKEFLSTLSLRRATGYQRPCGHPTKISIHALLAESDFGILLPCLVILYFYPRSPCGERL